MAKISEVDDKKILNNGMTLKEMADYKIQDYKHHQPVFDKKSDKGEK